MIWLYTVVYIISTPKNIILYMTSKSFSEYLGSDCKYNKDLQRDWFVIQSLAQQYLKIIQIEEFYTIEWVTSLGAIVQALSHKVLQCQPRGHFVAISLEGTPSPCNTLTLKYWLLLILTSSFVLFFFLHYQCYKICHPFQVQFCSSSV